MKRIYHILLFACLAFASTNTFAQLTWNNVGGTNLWEQDDNWDGVAIPTETDAVIFDGNVSNDNCVIADGVGAFALTITIQNNYTGTIEIEGGGSLTTDGNFTISATGFSGTLLINNTGILSVVGSMTINATGNGGATYTINGELYAGNLTVNSGTFNAGGADALEISPDVGAGTGNFNMSGSTFTAPSAATFIIVGTVSNRSSGTFAHNNGSIQYIIRGTRTLGSGFTGSNGFNNLRLGGSGAARTLTVSGTVDVAGTLSFESTGSAGLTVNSNSFNVSGGINTSDFLGSGGTGGSTTITLVGSSNQTFTGNSSNDPDGLLPNVTINQAGGGSVTISDRVNFGRDLTITSNGTITANSGSVISFGGTANTSTLTGTTTLTNIDLVDLIVNKSGQSLTISGTLTPNVRISGVLTPTAGTLNTNGKLIIRSTAANTSGQVGVVGGTISGNVTVQRFIPGSTGRKFRFLASPVTTSGGIDDHWQQQIHITGAGANGTACPTLTANDNGFDRTSSNGASMFIFNEGTNAWASIASTTGVNLTPGVGYRLFVRGPRSQGCGLLDGTNPAPNDVTLSASGTLATGTQNISTTFGTGAGWNLIGNPFQAIIDWDNVGRTNAQNWYVTFNPNAGVGGGGAYGTYTVGGSGTNGTSRYIGPGHAFWVEATAAGTISIEEADKAVTQTGSATVLFKTNEAKHVSIKVLDQNNYYDEVLVGFDAAATKCIDAGIDVEKFQFNQNAGNLATYNSCNATKYAINTLPTVNVNVIDTLFLHVRVPSTSANYRLSFEHLNLINAQAKVHLYDAFLNVFHDLRANGTYNFATIANNAASQGENRFSILIGQNLAPLPVKLTTFSAVATDNTSKLSWSTASERNSDYFAIERSTDGKTFEQIGVVKASGNASAATAYGYTDLNPVMNADNFYRLKMLDKDRSFSYSGVQVLSFAKQQIIETDNLVSGLYPVPAKNNITVSFSSNISGQPVAVKVFDVVGNEVLHLTNILVDAENKAFVELPANLNNGVYVIQVTDEANNTQRMKFTKE